MDYNKLAELIFPDITGTVDDLEARFPKRDLPEGAKVTRFAPSPTGYMHYAIFMLYIYKFMCGVIEWSIIYMKIFLIYLLLMNIAGFAAMGIDKCKARAHAWRIPIWAQPAGGTWAGIYAFTQDNFVG